MDPQIQPKHQAQNSLNVNVCYEPRQKIVHLLSRNCSTFKIDQNRKKVIKDHKGNQKIIEHQPNWFKKQHFGSSAAPGAQHFGSRTERDTSETTSR